MKKGVHRWGVVFHEYQKVELENGIWVGRDRAFRDQVYENISLKGFSSIKILTACFITQIPDSALQQFLYCPLDRPLLFIMFQQWIVKQLVRPFFSKIFFTTLGAYLLRNISASFFFLMNATSLPLICLLLLPFS